MIDGDPKPPALRRLFTLDAELELHVDTEESPLGRRIFNGVGAATFEGDRLRGRLMSGSGDWMLTRKGGGSVVDARVMLLTEDGAAIYMSYAGRIAIPPQLLAEARDPERREQLDPSRYYFRIAPVFETGAPRYAWLNDIVAIAVGRFTRQGLRYEVFEVL